MVDERRFDAGSLVRWIPFDQKRAPDERNAWRVEGVTLAPGDGGRGSVRASHADDEKLSVVDALDAFERISSPAPRASRLDPALLRAIRRIVVHENSPGNACPDGTASAIILHDALPQAEIVFASHGRLSLTQLRPEIGMLFCDITPPRERAEIFVEVGAFVLDHHEHQRDVVDMFGPRSVYGENAEGVSGAVLAFREVWLPLFTSSPTYVEDSRRAVLESLARLAGVRDTWQKTRPEWPSACEQAEGLRFWTWERLRAMDWSDARTMSSLREVGAAVLERNMIRDRECAASPMRFESRGVRVAVVPTTETSDVAELVDSDALVGFKHRWDVKEGRAMLVLSMRSRTGYDVGAVASWLGGGGHKAAAGASVECAERSPYAQIRELFEEWTARGVAERWVPPEQ